MSIESQLQRLERLVPHLAEHGCDVSAQDGARELMRYFDESAEEPADPGADSGEFAYERRALRRAYARLREQLNAIAEGRCGFLPVDEVGCFTRFYREHKLRVDTGQRSLRRRD
jgi:hypothetical protein